MQTVRARWPSDWKDRLVSAETSRFALLATVGRFGLSESFGPVRKSLQAPVPIPRPSASAIAVKRLRISWSSWSGLGSAVQGHGEDERTALGAVEPVEVSGTGLRARQVGFRIDARVVRPDEEIAPRNSEIHAAEPETPGHEAAGEGVAHGDLAELGEARVLVERHPEEGERAVVVLEPALVQHDGRAGPRPRHRPGQEVLPDRDRLVAQVARLGRRAEGVERAPGSVVHDAAVADVHQRRQREPADPHAATDAAGPLRVRVADDPAVGIEQRIAGARVIAGDAGVPGVAVGVCEGAVVDEEGLLLVLRRGAQT